MKRLARILCLALTLCMLFPAAMAEGVSNPNLATIIDLGGALPTPALPLVEEPITLTVMYRLDSGLGDFETMWFLNELEKETGIHLELEGIESGAWTERLNLAFAAEDTLPDLFMRGVSASDAAKYGMAGLLQPLNELIDQYAPNAKHLLEIMPNAVRNVSASDGNIYFMPSYNLTVRDLVRINGSINEAWIKQLGLELPKTLDGLTEVLKGIRDNDMDGDGDPANEIPLSFEFAMDSTGSAVSPILSAFGFVHSLHDINDGKYVYVPMQENFREYLKYMNMLWEENLLDHEIFTQTSDQYTAKCKSYTVGLMTNGTANQYFSEHEKKIAYSLLGPLTSEINSEPCWPSAQCEALPKVGSFCITKNCKYPEAAIKLLDYFYSDRGSTMIKCGPEKGQWDGEGGWTRKVNEDGSFSTTIEFDKEKYASYTAFRRQNTLMNMPFCYGVNQASIVLSADEYATRVSQMIFDNGLFDASREGYPAGVAFTEEEQEELALFVLLDNQVELWVAQFINGEKDVEDDAAWAEYLAMIESMDVETMIEIRQEAYERWAQF